MFALLCAAGAVCLVHAWGRRAEASVPAGSSVKASPRGADVKRVLYLTHSAGYRHEVIPLSARILGELGGRSGGFEVTATENVASISREGLKRYAAVVFYTTGELPLSAGQRAALLDFVKAGGGFVGVHSATDTFYQWPEYGEMIGGYFDGHPWHQQVRIKVEDRRHPSTRHLGESFTLTDEIYQFKNFSRSRVRVLLSLDAGSVDLGKQDVRRADRDFALAWRRNYGRGRVFYTALGHGAEVWRDERFQRHLVGGLRWAARL